MSRGKTLAFALTALAVLSLCGAAQATLTYTPVAFEYNSYNQGRDASYPQGTPTLGGIPFDIPIYPGNNNSWLSNPVTGMTLTIPVNIAGVREVHTLINVEYGRAGDRLTTLDFYWSGGTIYSQVLEDGVDIRDWWRGSGALTYSPPTVNVYTGTGLPEPHNETWMDKQVFTFDASYGDQVLTQIVITNTDAWDHLHRPFLSGVTVGAVPLPGAVWLLGSGLVGLAGLRKIFRKN